MDFSFFKTDNKSGYKTKESWFKKNYPDEYIKIITESSHLPTDYSFKEKIYLFYNNLSQRPKCLNCSSDVKFRNRFDKPYGDFCSLMCANSSKDEMLERQKKSMKKTYGVDYYPQHKEFISKQRKTKFKRYGNETFNNSNQAKITKKKRYGDENYNNKEKVKQTCIIKYGVDNYAKSRTYHQKLIKEFEKLYPNVFFEKIKKGMVVIKCPNCNETSEISKQLLYERYKRGYDCCLKCNPLGFKQRSGYEEEISLFLKELGINHITNYKLPNSKLEIDLFLPNHQLGIEFNGLYWHNELYKTENYHLEKTTMCKNKGIDLIHIFEDEWVYKKEIVKSVIKNKVNIVNDKIYARKCDVRMVSTTQTKSFLNENHIQGVVNSSIKLGLFFKDELVSLMTFSKGRIIMGGKSDEWELNRFCNKINTNVIGGASKLLTYFLKNFNPKKLISYSDVRLFDGKMYEKLSFEKTLQSKPNYWYVIGDKRHYRFNFNKSKLVKQGYDSSKTEKQIMFERKIYRIYDCGNVRWEFSVY